MKLNKGKTPMCFQLSIDNNVVYIWWRNKAFHYRYLPGHVLDFLICRCSLFYRRQLWASISVGVNSTWSLKIGWKNSSDHKRRIFVDKIGKFSWTLFTNSHGHFCPLEFLIWGDFSWTMFWWILVDIFGEFSWTLFWQ